MAKYKRSSNRPQPKHKKHKKSQHDKRRRLQSRNPKRKRTTAAKVPLTGAMQSAVSVLQAVMDARIAARLAIVVAGMLLADDRRTASAWFVAAGVRDDWDRFYDCLISVGRTSEKLAAAMLGLIVQKFAPALGDRILLAMDDSPTARYGRHVEGAGVHHHPTPGPADGKWLYGHNWVALAWLAGHPLWGVIALPLRSMLYVRQVDIPKLAEKYGWEFRTKHQLGVELLTWFMQAIGRLGVKAKVWLAVDGAMRRNRFSNRSLAWASSSSAACERTLVFTTCLKNAIPAAADGRPSMAKTESTWRSVPRIGGAGKRSPTIAAASRRPVSTRPFWQPRSWLAARSAWCCFASRTAVGRPISARTRRWTCATSWKPLPHAGQSRNTFTT